VSCGENRHAFADQGKKRIVLGLRSTLQIPWVYQLFARVVREGYWPVYLREYVEPAPGQRILDIGCGPGDVLAYLSDVDYVGVDGSHRYIKSARARFGPRGDFRCQAVADLVASEPASYDVIMANGLVHHLADNEVQHLFDVAGRLLKPTGRLVTFDGCFVPNQSSIVRTLLHLDRGRYVRTQQAYLALARSHFQVVEASVRDDLYRIPYTLLILVCRQAAVAARAA
jgi:SAM-dependent methyltransferase